ncbi:MAG: hypothetical protein B6244_06055 [Candidatus Cloacimonetes bacterium 4572_55]|nr:MAG: hypothetical protein B6244_06055 [Candidatus Cloacimonetes bacterium 4572_55]
MMNSRKLFGFVVVLICSIATFSCDDELDPIEPGDPGVPATELTATVGDREIDLEWDGSLGEDYIKFVIYNGQSMLWETTEFLNSITLIFNDNSGIYDLRVKTEDINGSQTTGTNMVRVSPRPYHTGEIIWEFSSSNPSGYDFSANQSLPMAYQNHNTIDIYLGTVNPDDTYNETNPNLVLKSPTIVQSDNSWQKDSWIEHHGQGSLDDFFAADVGSYQSATIEVGHVYHIKMEETIDGPKHYAKLRITSVNNSYPNRQITFEYAWQDDAEFTGF